ncbi:MAG: hypothetical protein LBC85_05950 [Fibromonadaceae bacterium]|jgi:hypothetical protein|nr:hypothetical protein [Fibromonadaceae bacterium]
MNLSTYQRLGSQLANAGLIFESLVNPDSDAKKYELTNETFVFNGVT